MLFSPFYWFCMFQVAYFKFHNELVDATIVYGSWCQFITQRSVKLINPLIFQLINSEYPKPHWITFNNFNSLMLHVTLKMLEDIVGGLWCLGRGTGTQIKNRLLNCQWFRNALLNSKTYLSIDSRSKTRVKVQKLSKHKSWSKLNYDNLQNDSVCKQTWNWI